MPISYKPKWFAFLKRSHWKISSQINIYIYCKLWFFIYFMYDCPCNFTSKGFGFSVSINGWSHFKEGFKIWQCRLKISNKGSIFQRFFTWYFYKTQCRLGINNKGVHSTNEIHSNAYLHSISIDPNGEFQLNKEKVGPWGLITISTYIQIPLWNKS